jgi:hypothetical protein
MRNIRKGADDSHPQLFQGFREIRRDEILVFDDRTWPSFSST